MKPIQKSWTPSGVNATGFKANATGATWTLTATTSADGMAHFVTITNNTANSHSDKTALLTGTDADGNVQTETMSLPGASTFTTSTKHFATLTSIVPSATIGADTMGIGWTEISVSPTIVLDGYQISPAFATTAVTGTINYSVQETGSDPFSTPDQSGVWVAPTAFASKTAAVVSVFDYSVRAVRLLVNSITAGATFSIAVNQSGIQA